MVFVNTEKFRMKKDGGSFKGFTGSDHKGLIGRKCKQCICLKIIFGKISFNFSITLLYPNQGIIIISLYMIKETIVLKRKKTM